MIRALRIHCRCFIRPRLDVHWCGLREGEAGPHVALTAEGLMAGADKVTKVLVAQGGLGGDALGGVVAHQLLRGL